MLNQDKVGATKRVEFPQKGKAASTRYCFSRFILRQIPRRIRWFLRIIPQWYNRRYW